MERPEDTSSRDPAGALADFAIALQAIAINCAEDARDIDSLAPDARRARFVYLENKLGEIGDLAHETRRVMRAVREEMEERAP